MANLAGFLKPKYTEKTIEVVVSDRFLDDDAKPLPFILKTLSHEKLKRLAERSRKSGKSGEIDQSLFISRCLVESCIQPDFKDRELCNAYGSEDPNEVPSKMLLASEFEALAKAFLELNGNEDEDLDLSKVTKN